MSAKGIIAVKAKDVAVFIPSERQMAKMSSIISMKIAQNIGNTKNKCRL